MDLAEAKRVWQNGLIESPLCRPILQLLLKEQKQAEAEYISGMEGLTTDKGIWNDITTFFLLSYKVMSLPKLCLDE